VEEKLLDAEFWVGVGTLIFLAIVVWKKVPQMVAKALDARAAVIVKELDEAKRLREEAMVLLAQYQAKRSQADNEAAQIVAEAKAESERYAAEARVQINQQIERRGKLAQDKIAQAEAQAIADVRALAVDTAVAAAEKLIAAKLDEQRAGKLVREAISDLPGKLN